MECIRALYGDPQHAQYLCFAPEQHYADADKTERLYHDMNSGSWWWSTQVSFFSCVRVICLIFSTERVGG